MNSEGLFIEKSMKLFRFWGFLGAKLDGKTQNFPVVSWCLLWQASMHRGFSKTPDEM